MKRTSVVLLGILLFAVVATPLILTSNADAAKSKADATQLKPGNFVIPPNILPPINPSKHVTIPAHHIVVHPSRQVPVLDQSPVKSSVDVSWSCAKDVSKKGNSENQCDFNKDLKKKKTNNGILQGNSDNSKKTAKSTNTFRDGFSNDTNPKDPSHAVNTIKVSVPKSKP